MSEHETTPINFEYYVEQGRHKLGKQLLKVATLQQDIDRRDNGKGGGHWHRNAGGQAATKVNQIVTLGSLHKRTVTWNDCTFYMSAEHAQAVAANGSPEKGLADVVSLLDSSNNSRSGMWTQYV